MKHSPIAFLLPLLLVASACGEDAAGEGPLVITAYGEEYVEEGLATDDGFLVTFDRFEATFEEVSIAGANISVTAPVDLAAPSEGEGHEIGRATVPAGRHDDATFVLARLAIAGSADDGAGVQKSFDLVFAPMTRFSRCETDVRVARGEEAVFEITLHADHLFYTSRGSHHPDVHFQALADADANDDGEITQDELEAADLGAYDPGSDGGDIDNLWDYLAALAAGSAHANGEAHCASAPAAE